MCWAMPQPCRAPSERVLRSRRSRVPGRRSTLKGSRAAAIDCKSIDVLWVANLSASGPRVKTARRRGARRAISGYVLLRGRTGAWSVDDGCRERAVSRGTRLVFGGLGTAVFVSLVAHTGVGRLRADALATGWMIVPIVLLYGLVHACSAGALQLILQDEPRRPGFARIWAIGGADTAINFITPSVNAGGEPYKIAELAPDVGTARAAGAVVLHAILRLLGFLLVWLTALFLGLELLPRTPATLGLLAGGVVAVGALIALLLLGHRRRPLERLLDLLHRVPGLRRLARRLEARRARPSAPARPAAAPPRPLVRRLPGAPPARFLAGGGAGAGGAP